MLLSSLPGWQTFVFCYLNQSYKLFLLFSQTVYSRLCDACLLAREYETILLVKKILKLLVSLAYLEPAMVVRGFEVSGLTVIAKS